MILVSLLGEMRNAEGQTATCNENGLHKKTHTDGGDANISTIIRRLIIKNQ